MHKFINPKIDKFIKREKRFLSYMKEEGLVFCPNPGRIADVLILDSRCIISEQTSKIPCKWEAIEINNNWIGVNTQNPNKLGAELVRKLFPEEDLRREVSFNRYRADFASKNIVVEIKNVHWIPDNKGDHAYFPDCVTARGARQMIDLANLQEQGYQCYVIYIIQRQDAKKLSIAKDIDKKYYESALYAKSKGLKSMAFNCSITLDGINIKEEVEIID